MGGFVKAVAPKPKAPEQPKVVSQMDAPKPIETPKGPTDIEMDQKELDNKRRGRRNTILTSAQGLGENLQLNKKTLLG